MEHFCAHRSGFRDLILWQTDYWVFASLTWTSNPPTAEYLCAPCVHQGCRCLVCCCSDEHTVAPTRAASQARMGLWYKWTLRQKIRDSKRFVKPAQFKTLDTRMSWSMKKLSHCQRNSSNHHLKKTNLVQKHDSWSYRSYCTAENFCQEYIFTNFIYP